MPEARSDALSTAARADLERVLRILRVLTLALSLGVAALAAVVVFWVGSGALGDEPTVDPALLPWTAAGAILLLGLAPALRRGIAAGGERRDEVVQGFLSGGIVALALRESVGIVGLVLGLLAGSIPWGLGFAAASIAAMALSWPRGDELEARLQRLPPE